MTAPPIPCLARLSDWAKSRIFWLAVTLAALTLEGFALFSQYVWGIQPCNECILIRTGVLGIAVAGVLGAVAPKVTSARVAASGLLVAALAWALYRAYVLVSIEYQVAHGVETGCKFFKGFPDWAPLDVWFPAVFEPRGKCGEIVGVFLGQSFAVWGLVGLSLLALPVLAVLVAGPVRSFLRREVAATLKR